MFKPKMVFTALSVWFLFHLVIFFIVAPSMLKDMPDMSEKALFMSSSMMQSSGILMVFLCLFMYLCRDLKLEEAKKFLLTLVVCLF